MLAGRSIVMQHQAMFGSIRCRPAAVVSASVQHPFSRAAAGGLGLRVTGTEAPLLVRELRAEGVASPSTLLEELEEMAVT
mmetsp:Transcript_3398/g.9828  ORF Transcript_3398/g.9828 Transcript_3398/m.9828 type:complete len:80 (-) Transcript_3398:1579-1818(-)